MKKTDKNQLNISLEVNNESGGSGTNDFYFYTNRDNLLIFLASGFIIPRNMNKKYYTDFGSSIDNGIILLKDKLSLKYLNSLAESENSFPVCLKITLPQNYISDVFFICLDGEILKSAFGKKPEYYKGMIVPGLITMRSDFKIFFNDNYSLKEFTAREFEDISFDHFILTADSEMFEGKEDINLSELKVKPGLPVIKRPELEIVNRLAAVITVMEKAAEKYPEDFLIRLMEYYSLYFENFTSKGIKKISHYFLTSKTEQTDSDMNDLKLILIPLTASVSDIDPTIGFNNFIKEFKLSKKLNPENFISLFSVYCSIKTIMKFDSSNRNYAEYLTDFRDQFLNNISKSKKKISETEIKEIKELLLKGEKFLNSEISYEDIKKFPDLYNSIKYFLLFLKRFDFESISEYQIERDDYDLNLTSLLYLKLLAAVWSGLDGLPGKLKRYNEVTTGCFDAIINYISDTSVYKFSSPKITKTTIVSEENEYELITDSINGVYGYTYTTVKKDYHTGIKKQISEKPVPESTSELIELARYLKIPGVVRYSASVLSKDFIQQKTINDQSVFYAGSAFNLNTEFSSERFINYIRDKATESELRKIPLKLKLRIENLYRNTDIES